MKCIELVRNLRGLTFIRKKGKGDKMFKGVFRKSLSLLIAMVFAISTIAQGAPVSVYTLRTTSLANASNAAQAAISKGIKGFPAPADIGHNELRRNLVKLSEQLQGEIQQVDEEDVIAKIAERFKIVKDRIKKLTDYEAKTEPANSWESLVALLQRGKIRFIIEDLSKVSLDTYPSGIEHYATFVYVNEENGDRISEETYTSWQAEKKVLEKKQKKEKKLNQEGQTRLDELKSKNKNKI